MFSDVVPLLEAFTSGYNAALLCYGLTSSGKTYTMQGVVQQCIEFIIANTPDAFLTASYLQIYNEQLQDLLEEGPALRIRESGQSIYVENLSQFIVKTPADVEQLLEIGAQRRTTAATVFNELSSRSHVVLTLSLERRVDGETTRSKLQLVDLAGSEKLASNDKSLIKETQNINRSLNALGNVIFALTD